MRNALVATLILSACVTGLHAAETKPLPHREPGTGIVLPKVLGSMQGQGVTTYDRPEMGISARYSLPGFFKADVYVYDGGLKNLGTGIQAEPMKPHFQEVQDALSTMEKKGSYKDVKRLDEKETSLVAGGKKIPALLACYEFSEGPAKENVEFEGKRISYILLTAYKDNFLKLRFTFPEKDKAKGEKLLKKLQADLGGLLK